MRGGSVLIAALIAGSPAATREGAIHHATGTFAVTITPDTGTGALAGIAGTLAIRIDGGLHHDDLA